VVPLLFLTAQGVEKWSWRILAILCLISILQYSIGTFLLRWV